MKVYPFLKKFKVTSPYGVRGQVKTQEGYGTTNHKGIDIVGIDDKNVVSVMDGIVYKVAYSSTLGNYVWITNSDGSGCIYQHLASTSIRAGQKVSAKQKIGVMGSTGNSSGPHLHFGVATNGEMRPSYYDNNWQNPAIWFGIQDVGNLTGKVFDGSGFITGYPDGVTSTNNDASSVVTTETTTETTERVVGYLDSIMPSGQTYKVTDFVGTTSDWLYGRRYRILVDIGGGQAFDVSELRCEFEIIKTAYLEPNQSTVKIYNLNPEDENKLIKQGQRVVIEAGYTGSQYGKIFEGNIIQPLRSKENGIDYCLTLVSMDSDRYATYGLIGVSLVAEQSSRNAISALIEKAKVKTEAGYIANTKIVYPRGKVMFGVAKDFLAQIARSENATYYSEDGKVNIIQAQDVDKNSILAFGPTTGLIGTPTQSEYGVSVSVLLNPQVKINTLFYVDNKKIENYRYNPGSPVRSLDSQGIYRVIKLTHRGDTRGNDWFTDIEAISQAGILPGMMAGSSIYPW